MARFLLISSESARFELDKDYEMSQLKKLKELMIKDNIKDIVFEKIGNKKISLFDIDERLSILQFNSKIDSSFDKNYVSQVFLNRVKEGEYALALNILDKKIIANPEMISLDLGILLE